MRERSPLDPIVNRVATGHTTSVKARTDIAIKNRGWTEYTASGARVVTRAGLEAWRARCAEILSARNTTKETK